MLNHSPDAPLDSDDVTRHCQSDPELKAQLYAKGYIMFLAGKYLLTAKGRFEFARRARARAEAVRQGLVDPSAGVAE
jgi:hypothetical protein